VHIKAKCEGRALDAVGGDFHEDLGGGVISFVRGWERKGAIQKGGGGRRGKREGMRGRILQPGKSVGEGPGYEAGGA